NHALGRGDYGRAPAGRVGRVSFYPSAVPDYVSSLAFDIDPDVVRNQALRLYSSHPPEAGDILNMAGDRFGVEVRLLGDGGPGDASTGIRGDISADIEQLVKTDGASVGAVFGPTMETVSLVDESGRRVAGDALLVLLVRAILEMSPGSTVVIPANFPGIAEDLARRLGGRALRAKTSLPALMGRMLEHADRTGVSQFRAWFDGLYCLLKLLEWRAWSGKTLVELVDSAPPARMAVRTVHCPWEAKGRVMRSLVTTLPSEAGDLVEGVKIRRDKDWTLILPDEDEPAYHVYTEAASMEVAEEIADSFARKVTELRDSPDNS
ncbi:MAG: hypothetical protein ACM3WT_07170, partial [Bacillota bacterium]